jgi:putative SOS response-associated peptidase YedK
MPVILMPKDYDDWLAGEVPPEDRKAMLKPYDSELMRAYQVSRAVNSVKADGPALMEEVTTSAAS